MPYSLPSLPDDAFRLEEPRIKHISRQAKGVYANILLDDWFKRTFAELPVSRRLLTLFLQELIPERQIADIKYAPQEHTNLLPDKRGIRVDVEVTDADGSRFLVEMQRKQQEFFYERAVYNAAHCIIKQLDQGEDEYDFPTVYFIGLADFALHDDPDRVLYRYSIREDTDGDRMTDRVQYIFLELPNCGRALTTEATVLDNLCYALHYMPFLEERPAELRQEIFELLFETAEIATFTPEDKVKYEFNMTTERDIRNQIRFAEKQAAAKAEAKAEAKIEAKVAEQVRKARMEDSIKTARLMLADHKPMAEIVKYSGLTEEQVRGL